MVHSCRANETTIGRARDPASHAHPAPVDRHRHRAPALGRRGDSRPSVRHRWDRPILHGANRSGRREPEPGYADGDRGRPGGGPQRPLLRGDWAEANRSAPGAHARGDPSAVGTRVDATSGVSVTRPARGVVDAVFEQAVERVLVVSEAYSVISRLEQQIRWSADKATSIGSSSLVGPSPDWSVSRLLILRSTATNRDLTRAFEATLRAAYPAPTRSAVMALTAGEPWPGDAIIWVRIEGDVVELLDGPPRGVTVGR
jgi:hypothetical protein